MKRCVRSLSHLNGRAVVTVSVMERQVKKSDRNENHLGGQHAGNEAEAMLFWSIAEVAEHLNVHCRTVRRWIDKGLLVVHRVGVVVRIADGDLRAFLTAHRDD